MLEECFEELKRLERAARSKAVKEVVLERAKELAPKDTEDMINTGYITDDAVGFSSPYAMKQHEDLTLRHPNGGEAKFLEKAVDQSEQKIFNIIKGGG